MIIQGNIIPNTI